MSFTCSIRLRNLNIVHRPLRYKEHVRSSSLATCRILFSFLSTPTVARSNYYVVPHEFHFRWCLLLDATRQMSEVCTCTTLLFGPAVRKPGTNSTARAVPPILRERERSAILSPLSLCSFGLPIHWYWQYWLLIVCLLVC